jgi:DNA-binding transcriptional ArsR family regulator
MLILTKNKIVIVQLSYTETVENAINLPKEKAYYVTTDEEGNIKGYFQLKDNNLGKDWFAMYQNPALWLGQQKMTGEQYSVLWVLFNKLDFDNYLRVSRQEIAELLEMKPVNVSRAMKVLKEKNIIIEGPPAGKFKTYRFNPYIAHKGKNRTGTILEFGDALEKSGKRITDADINKK